MIDTHIHLEFDDFASDFQFVLSRARDIGVESFLIPAASLHTLKKAKDIANAHEDIYYAVGIHPCHVDEISIHTEEGISFHADALQLLQDSLHTSKCRAIGECGLDFYRLSPKDTKSKDMQIACFHAQIEWAIKHDLPLILHVRDSKEGYDASSEIARILSYYEKRGEKLRGVFHCYNACPLLLDFSHSFYYGIGGIITFKNADSLTQILPQIPLSRLLLETDAPFLAPMPHRGKRNESSFLTHIAEKISTLLALPYSEITALTTANAKMLFRI